jgi:hypothetical protein
MRKQCVLCCSLAIFGFAALLRLGIFFACALPDARRVFTQDSLTYERPALNLLQHGVFSSYDLSNGIVEPHGPSYMKIGVNRITATKGPYLYEVFRTPFYPVFLAALYGLFGHMPLLAVFVQCLLGASTCVLLYLIGVSAGLARAGAWGGILLSVDPCSMLNCCFLQSETWFTWLMYAGLFTIVLYATSHRYWPLVFAGCFLGLSILCRPAGMFLPLVLGFALFFRPGASWQQRVSAPLIFLAATFFTVLPWMYRNYIHFGVWQLSSLPGLNLFYCKAADLEAGSLGDEPRANLARQRLEKAIEPALQERPRNQFEMANLYQEYGVKKILAQPGRYLKLHVLGTIKLFLAHDADTLYELCRRPYERTGLFTAILEGPADSESGEASSLDQRLYVSISLAQIVWLLLLYVLGAAGLWLGRASGQTWILALFTLTILYFGLTPGPQGIARFRVPAMPGLCFLAGVGIDRLPRSRHSTRLGIRENIA